MNWFDMVIRLKEDALEACEYAIGIRIPEGHLPSIVRLFEFMHWIVIPLLDQMDNMKTRID